jgi:hypothetical protein
LPLSSYLESASGIQIGEKNTIGNLLKNKKNNFEKVKLQWARTSYKKTSMGKSPNEMGNFPFFFPLVASLMIFMESRCA